MIINPFKKQGDATHNPWQGHIKTAFLFAEIFQCVTAWVHQECPRHPPTPKCNKWDILQFWKCSGLNQNARETNGQRST